MGLAGRSQESKPRLLSSLYWQGTTPQMRKINSCHSFPPPSFHRSCPGKKKSPARAPCFPLSLTLLITHHSHVHPLSNRPLSKACSLLDIPGWRTHDWDAVYKTAWFYTRLSLCPGQPSLCLHFCENEF